MNKKNVSKQDVKEIATGKKIVQHRPNSDSESCHHVDFVVLHCDSDPEKRARLLRDKSIGHIRAETEATGRYDG